MSETTTSGRMFGAELHRVADRVVLRRLASDLTEQMGPGWFALVLFSDGRWAARGESAKQPMPLDATVNLMRRAAAALNAQTADGGHWVVALRPEAREIAALWRDGDGDAHVVVEYDQRIHALHAWTDDQLASPGAAALNLYRLQVAKVDVSPEQMFRRALGEKPTAH